VAHGAADEHWLLRECDEAGAHLVGLHCGYVDVVDPDCPLVEIN
jgi:hypothetical protein